MIKAILFDMDGVISDTQKLHSQVESDILSRFGINLSPSEITFKYSGVKTKEFFKELLTEKGVDFDLDNLMKEKWEKMATLAKISIDPIDGIYELLDLANNLNLKLAVASASEYDYAKEVLSYLNIFNRFKSIVTGNMVSRGKPEPDIFLLAANNININPLDCLVIEDGISGMTAASKANMACIGLVKNIDFNKYPTKNQVLSLRDIDSTYLLNI